ncbi:MAG: helix-turn-helix transcriptional regulator [Oscillospiraceae bacterium]|nr:helix-turn-helix transcriptional regulator [Oscillospiraceae bacterium]
MDKAALGKKIREARRKKGYTQHALAEIADIGDVYLGEIERGLKMPSLHIFIKLIEALDISADFVLRDELASGKEYIYDEITQKLKDLTPKQRKTAADILDAYLSNLDLKTKETC